jgi:glycosyltransferase involved in cell wall biosynthesis
MSSSAEIAVIVASHSRPGPLGRVLASVARQQGVALEVVVVDNPSARSEEIAGVVAAFAGVRLVGLADNVGFGRAINRGVAATTAPLLYFACDDVELGDGCLRELRDVHLSRQAPGLTAPVIYDANDPGRIRYAGGAYSIGLNVRLDLFKALPASGSREPFAVSYVPGGALLTCRELFLRLGGYREDFFMYEEDTELSQRVRRAGRDLVVVPRASTFDQVPPGTYDPRVVRPDMIRNHLATALLHAPAALAPLLFARKLLGEARRLPGLRPEERRHWVIGWGRFLAAVPLLLRDRRRNARVRRALRTAAPTGS